MRDKSILPHNIEAEQSVIGGIPLKLRAYHDSE
jgi:hypothetical protein